MGAVLAATQLLRDRPGATVVVLHHPPKSDEENDRGSSAFSGGCANTFFVAQKHGILVDDEARARRGAS